MFPTKKILGVSFFSGRPEDIPPHVTRLGFVVVPSAPVLVAMEHDEAHCHAVQSSDLAIADSGWMVLLWVALTGGRLPRISGLRFLQTLIESPAFRSVDASCWVMPNAADAAANRAWLATQGITVSPESCYEAPHYPKGPLHDGALLAMLEARRPAFVVICLGGGVQERLGHSLRQRLSYRPTIICIGAAIAFLSGQQVVIPTWADRLYLGWLFRTISDPGLYFPRYWRSLRLARLLVRHRELSPRPACLDSTASASLDRR